MNLFFPPYSMIVFIQATSQFTTNMALLLNQLTTLKDSTGSVVPTQWEHEIIDKSNLNEPDLPALHEIAEINKDYEHWIGTLPGTVSSGEYADLAAHQARVDLEQEMERIEGMEFFTSNDLHPYQDFYQQILLQETAPVFDPTRQEYLSVVEHQFNQYQKPPFHLHYTQTTAGLNRWDGLLPEHIVKRLVLSAVGPNGKHLTWITEQSGVAWIWLDYNTTTFQIWGAQDKLAYACHLLEQHIQHIYTQRFKIIPLCLEHPSIDASQYLHMDQFETTPFTFQEPAITVSGDHTSSLGTLHKMVIGHNGCHLKWISKQSQVSPIYLDTYSNTIMMVGSPSRLQHAESLLREHIGVVFQKLNQS